MYNQFFGFRERPFKLVPDPDYLFLSKSHEEALAHLRYAVTDGEGFVEIIGEIGTGKTMLCRTFLERLGENTESAYIFNPRMDALDLLKAINDEFGVSETRHSIKALIDGLNAFLMEKKAAGQQVILLIDEAQNLSTEVLEQLRLLSNLETTKDKLLQIILVGQPELSEKLDSYALRQLGQRISLRCRLHPLTYAETKEYIAHRLQVASQKSAAVFSNRATRRIYRFSKGIPRLINMACDRSLLTAFGRHRPKVSGAIAKSAIRELSSRGEFKQTLLPAFAKRLFAFSAAGIVLAFVMGLLVNPDMRHLILKSLSPDTSAVVEKKEMIPPGPIGRMPPDSSPLIPETKESSDSSGKLNAPLMPSHLIEEPAFVITKNPPPIDFQALVNDAAGIFSRDTAVLRLVNQWMPKTLSLKDLNEITDDPAFFSLAAKQAGLEVTLVDNDLARVVRLNLPAILKFNHPAGGAPVYLTAVKATPEAMIFSGTDTSPEITVPYARIPEHWSGTGFVFWKNFYNYTGTIPIDAPGESVITLKLHLRDIGYRHIAISGTYDLATRMTIQAIQARHGIPIDGFVGPLTKIVLYNEKHSLAIPHLWEQMKIFSESMKMKTEAAETD